MEMKMHKFLKPLRSLSLPALILLLLFLASCEKEDSAYTLSPPGEEESMIAHLGNNYENQVFVDLSTGNQVTRSYKIYDLAFEASATGWRCYLNTAKYMFVANTGDTAFFNADTSGLQWKTETDNLYDDSTAFGDWRGATDIGMANVFIIDRGKTEHFGADRFRKMRITSYAAGFYQVTYSNLNNSGYQTLLINKDDRYSLMYFSFSNNGGLVAVAPYKELWDLVFTKYTHTYYEEPVESPYRYYMVTGTLLNKWGNASNYIIKKDSTLNFISFDSVKAQNMSLYPFNKNAGQIGFEWKTYDFNLGYLIIPDVYYLVQDEDGYYYKIRFYDFYDDQGNKGAASFIYQRL